MAWTSTTLVIAEVDVGAVRGLGYTYADRAAACLIERRLAEVLQGLDALATGACWRAMVDAVRNVGRPGVASMAIAAVDIALWDIRGRLLGAPFVHLLGAVRPAVPVYGSGGFTSYSDAKLQEQLHSWAASGIRSVKIKIGREPHRDAGRVALARQAIGEQAELMVDGNGAYNRKQAMTVANVLAEHAVSWFEEPVSSDDLAGLRALRDVAPAPIEIAAGEYGYDSMYFRRMLDAGAVDVLQVDATRCCGITGFMEAGALCQAFDLPLSAHCAPSLHCQLCCVTQRARHLEWFHDHVRIEQMLFEGAPVQRNGWLTPDNERPGIGLDFKRIDAERFAV